MGECLVFAWDNGGMSLLPDNAECRAVADELLTRHTLLQAEANITSQIREFLVRTGLVESGDIREEVAPAEGSGNSVDLAALDTLIELSGGSGMGSCRMGVMTALGAEKEVEVEVNTPRWIVQPFFRRVAIQTGSLSYKEMFVRLI